MMRNLSLLAIIHIAVIGAGVDPAAAEDAAPVVDIRLASERLTIPFSELIERVKLPPGRDIRVENIASDATSSHHVAAIRTAELPHVHEHNDLLVMILRGHGKMFMDLELREVGEGSILYVPRGTVHAFENHSPEPAVAYVIYTPPIVAPTPVDTPTEEEGQAGAMQSTE